MTLKWKSNKSVKEEIYNFLNLYGSKPYILNLFGNEGIGKTTMLYEVAKTIPDITFDIVDITDEFENNTERFFKRIKGLKPIQTLSGKYLVFLIRYPQSLNDKKIQLLSKITVPTVLITEQKVYQLNKSAIFVKVPLPHKRTLHHAATEYIKKNNYPMPNPYIIAQIVGMASTFPELYSIIDSIQPDYDLSKVVLSSSHKGGYDDFQLISYYLQNKIKPPYYVMNNPKIMRMLLITILSVYKNYSYITPLLDKIAHIDANKTKLDSNIQQALWDNLIQISPSSTRVSPKFAGKPSVVAIPGPLVKWAKEWIPDNPIYALQFMIQTNLMPPYPLKAYEVNEIKRFYKYISSIEQVFKVKSSSDITL